MIANRDLFLREGDNLVRISVRIFAPEQEKPGVWGCRYEVDWPKENRAATAWGFDGIHRCLSHYK